MGWWRGAWRSAPRRSSRARRGRPFLQRGDMVCFGLGFPACGHGKFAWGSASNRPKGLALAKERNRPPGEEGGQGESEAETGEAEGHREAAERQPRGNESPGGFVRRPGVDAGGRCAVTARDSQAGCLQMGNIYPLVSLWLPFEAMAASGIGCTMCLNNHPLVAFVKAMVA